VRGGAAEGGQTEPQERRGELPNQICASIGHFILEAIA
jgi:hypothetical protein